MVIPNTDTIAPRSPISLCHFRFRLEQLVADRLIKDYQCSGDKLEQAKPEDKQHSLKLDGRHNSLHLNREWEIIIGQAKVNIFDKFFVLFQRFYDFYSFPFNEVKSIILSAVIGNPMLYLTTFGRYGSCGGSRCCGRG